MSTEKVNLEKRVEAIRSAKRMTVGEVLSYLQISPPMWSMIRNGTRSPSIKTIRRIEAAEIDAGIRESPPPPRPPIVAESQEMFAARYSPEKNNESLARQVDELREYIAGEFRKLHDEIQELKKGRKP